MRYDTVVIGAGPAGLVSAGVAAARSQSVLVLEKMEKPARKLRITGKGRCNITNMRPREEFLEHIRQGRDFFAHSFDTFDNVATTEFFRNIGIELVVERGERVFPASGRAQDVAWALQKWCTGNGATIKCGCAVDDIVICDGTVCAVTTKGMGRVECRNVIIATGGMSYPATGSTGDGYSLAHKLGHTIVPVRPSLTPLECRMEGMEQLHGLMLRNVAVKLEINSAVVAEEFGEMEFVDFSRGRNVPGQVPARAAGVGGATVLKLSRMAVDALIDEKDVALSVDLKPALGIDKLVTRIEREARALPASSGITVLLRKLLPGGMDKLVARTCGYPLHGVCGRLGRTDFERLAAVLKRLVLPVSEYRPFEEAVITAGGVALNEVDKLTLRSKLIGGLYLAGEVLDLDADTGGYNLQIAFSTGHLAGRTK